jgi:hypothetical protein
VVADEAGCGVCLTTKKRFADKGDIMSELLDLSLGQFSEVINTCDIDLDEIRTLLIDRHNSAVSKKQSIETQLEKAKIHRLETGQYSDPGWYHGATSAKKFAGRESQKYQQMIGVLNRAQKRKNKESGELSFKDAARMALDPKDYQKIIDMLNTNAG